LAHSQTDADDSHWQQHHQQHQRQPELAHHQVEPDMMTPPNSHWQHQAPPISHWQHQAPPNSHWQHQEAGMKQDTGSDLHASRPHDELSRREDSHAAADDLQDVNMRLQQVITNSLWHACAAMPSHWACTVEI